ncbi:MAG TPA: DUF4962 domain-containing protein [Planctomycetota bacterium]|nr:DUF4962 domain-containing protein [Planctomycetota bacterium]
MRSQRHPHPHVDPRQPRRGSRPATNPPVFAWKPPKAVEEFCLVVARDPELRDAVLTERGLTDPVFLPEKAFGPGHYWWQWSGPGAEGEILDFEIGPEAVVVEIPSVEEWLRRFPAAHPRIWTRPEEVEALRESRATSRAALWRELSAAADRLLGEPHEMSEPPFLPPWEEDYSKTYALWKRIAFDSRAFVAGAETLALAWLAGGREDCARAACRRLASVSRWDPAGSTHLEHNDEPHMSVIWWGPTACDWAWDRFAPEERELVIQHFRRRGQITFEEMHGRGCYGITRFDSHAGREIVFLAQVSLVFHERIPEARRWLEWLRPVLCGVWPIWAGDDGAWAEGPSYGLAYVAIMGRFASALKCGTGVDLFRRPFWAGHARWRELCLPAYAEWMGFGDHTEHWSGTWMANADLVELIDRETGAGAFGEYVEDCRRWADIFPTPPERRQDFAGFATAQNYFIETAPARSVAARREPPVLGVFEAAGWAAFRTDLRNPERDVAMIFRSSPYGSTSHSHANNNDFILHVGGKVLAQPSGYYDGYGSNHHMHWNWHTKSHNCATLSGASQPVQSEDSRGAIRRPFEDARLAYLVGDADASYAPQAERCRRHVVFLKEHGCFVLIDEFVAGKGSKSAFEWNIHSWARFEIDEAGRSFRLERDGSRLAGQFLYHRNAFFTLSEGWEPPPKDREQNDQWLMQHHLRFTTSGFERRRNLGVVLCPETARLRAPAVTAAREGKIELARIGGDLVLVNQGEGVAHAGKSSGGVALLAVGGAAYEIGDWGVRLL